MKQLFILFSLTILLVACSDKDVNQNATDSTSVVVPVDSNPATAINTPSYSNIHYTEGINHLGTKTIVTHTTELYSDSALQHSTGLHLLEGDMLTVEEYVGNHISRDWAEPVYKISYTLDKQVQYGYLPQSKIACQLDTLKSGKMVSLTVDYNQGLKKFTGEVALIQSEKMLAKENIELDVYTEGDAPYTFYYYFDFEENKPSGLAGIQEGFSISTAYPACGYPGFDYTFLWNGKKLISCPETYSVSDSGMFYSHSYLIFPADSLGKAGYILNILQLKEFEEEQAEEGLMEKVNHDSTVIEYKWNAGNFTFSAGDTVLKTSRNYTH